jgi:hypothetical protein
MYRVLKGPKYHVTYYQVVNDKPESLSSVLCIIAQALAVRVNFLRAAIENSQTGLQYWRTKKKTEEGK